MKWEGNEDYDPFATPRGCLHGLLVTTVFWAALILLIYILTSVL